MQGTNITETAIISGIMLIYYILTGKSFGIDNWVMITYPMIASFVWNYNNLITLKIYNEQHDYRKELNSKTWYLYVMKAFKLTYIALILSILHHLANLDTYAQFYSFLRLDLCYTVMFTFIILSINKPHRINKIK